MVVVTFDPAEEVARILAKHANRITRLENSQFSEAVPTPIVETVDRSGNDTDTVNVTVKDAGAMNWGDSWGLSEWQ